MTWPVTGPSPTGDGVSPVTAPSTPGICTGRTGMDWCGLLWPTLTGLAAWVHGLGVDWATRRTHPTWEEDR